MYRHLYGSARQRAHYRPNRDREQPAALAENSFVYLPPAIQRGLFLPGARLEKRGQPTGVEIRLVRPEHPTHRSPDRPRGE